VDWIRENGWCIDNIEVMPASDPSMGRGAFARYPLAQGQVVTPAPLQIFRDRSVFETLHGGEQLYVNYCLQPKNSRLMFFPYGQGVGVINHSREKANVRWQWSHHSMHHADWLDLSVDELVEVSKPGGIILEVVAIRNIEPGEELFLDYGPGWEEAWKSHVATWTPPKGAESYVYPADVDETLPLRTVLEQEKEPYAENLGTMCATPDWSSRKSGRTIQWYEVRRHKFRTQR
jgi:SET domain